MRKAGLPRPKEGARLPSEIQSEPLQPFVWGVFIGFYFTFYFLLFTLKHFQSYREEATLFQELICFLPGFPYKAVVLYNHIN